jgi:hypothetical protein
MIFHPNEPFDNNKGQHIAWTQLKNAFASDEGVAYYRYPIFSGRGSHRREPDILLIHRQFGIWVLECKGCRIGNIVAIQGHEWEMWDWHHESETPIAQAEDQMWAVKGLLEKQRELRSLNVLQYRVVLSFVKKNEWARKGFEKNPTTRGVVWLEEDLEPLALREAYASPPRATCLSSVICNGRAC